jgi:hypothetical protein
MGGKSQNLTGRWAKLSASAVLDKRLTAAALRVLAVLGTYADAHGLAWPSVETIAGRLGLKRRVVHIHLKKLHLLGYIDIRPRSRIGLRGGRPSNVYCLNFPDLPSEVRWDCASFDNLDTSSDGSNCNAIDSEAQSSAIEVQCQYTQTNPTKTNPGKQPNSHRLGRIKAKKSTDPFTGLVKRIVGITRMDAHEVGVWVTEYGNDLYELQEAGSLTFPKLKAALQERGLLRS